VHPESLHQIVINLLDNAVKHGGAGPIRLATTLADGCLRLTVDDRGPGIPAEQDRVWQPFGSSGGPSHPRGAGSGWPWCASWWQVTAAAGAEDRPHGGADSWSSCRVPPGGAARDGPGRRAGCRNGGVMARVLVVKTTAAWRWVSRQPGVRGPRSRRGGGWARRVAARPRRRA
jgi:hypothetical protein